MTKKCRSQIRSLNSLDYYWLLGRDVGQRRRSGRRYFFSTHSSGLFIRMVTVSGVWRTLSLTGFDKKIPCLIVQQTEIDNLLNIFRKKCNVLLCFYHRVTDNKSLKNDICLFWQDAINFKATEICGYSGLVFKWITLWRFKLKDIRSESRSER